MPWYLINVGRVTDTFTLTRRGPVGAVHAHNRSEAIARGRRPAARRLAGDERGPREVL